MGKSYTYHVLGDTKDGRLYPCMNRREMQQATIKAEKLGDKIIQWTSQTGTGTKMLGGTCWASAAEITPLLPDLVTCPICEGRGCIVCDFSGATTPGYWERWEPWQRDWIKTEVQKEA